MNNLLVISVKPRYMDAILKGDKLIELRKCKPIISIDNTIVVLYCTAPVKAVVGVCLVEELIEDSPENLWEEFSHLLGIDEKSYFEYYDNQTLAIGIKLKNIFKLECEIPLKTIKAKLPKFTPPQTYKYFEASHLNNVFREEIKGEYRELRRTVALRQGWALT